MRCLPLLELPRAHFRVESTSVPYGGRRNMVLHCIALRLPEIRAAHGEHRGNPQPSHRSVSPIYQAPACRRITCHLKSILCALCFERSGPHVPYPLLPLYVVCRGPSCSDRSDAAMVLVL